MPNLAVAMDAWARLACYPRGNFYPISYGDSTIDHRITKACFRTCSTCRSHSQAHYYTFTLCVRFPSVLSAPLHASVTVLEATAPVKLPTIHYPATRFRVKAVRVALLIGRCFIGAEAPSYTTQINSATQCKAIVKLHGVFLSCNM